MYTTSLRSVLSALAITSLLVPAATQTWSSCNPLTQGGCPPNPALGRSVAIDFTSGPSSEFSASGGPTYDSNGAAFTVSQPGDSPSLSSNWYIMFGHVDFVVKAAPGTGIVSAAILQSDCLDEIDWEWLGGDNTQAQSNYFGKGITTTGYNRGAFHGAASNHDQFHTYSIDWTADQIVWSIDGSTVRAMTKDQAQAGQYPQTPMYVKMGAWAGGDPSNPQGTIEWAGGITDFTAGPFTMYVKSVHVTDYSTGTQYTYSGSSGTWESIRSDGGQINPAGNGTPVQAGSAPAVTSQVPDSAPLGFGNNANSDSVTATRTGWPWTGTATATVVTAISSPGSQSAPVSPSLSASASSLTVFTSWDNQGFLTTVTTDAAALTAPISYNSQGFPVTVTSAIASTNILSATNPGLSSAAGQQTDSLSGSTTNSAAASESGTQILSNTISPSSAASAGGGSSDIEGSVTASTQITQSSSNVVSTSSPATTNPSLSSTASSDSAAASTPTIPSNAPSTTLSNSASNTQGLSSTSSSAVSQSTANTSAVSPSESLRTSTTRTNDSQSTSRSESTLATSTQTSASSSATSGTPPAPNEASLRQALQPPVVLLVLCALSLT